MDKFEVRYLQIDEYPLWDEFLHQAQGGNIYSSSQWLQAVEKIFHIPVKIVAVFHEKAIIGGVGAAIRKIPLIGLWAGPSPVAAYNSILVLPRNTSNLRKQETKWNAIIEPLCEFLENEYQRVDLINHTAIHDIRPFQWRGWKDKIYYTYELDLHDCEGVWNSLYNDVRSKVKKCEREKIMVSKEGNAENFYRLWKKTFQRQKSAPPIGEKELSWLFEELKKNGKLIVYEAKKEDKTISAIAVALDFNGIAHEWQSATEPEYLSLGAFPFLMWSVIKDLSRQGFSRLDFDGAGLKGVAFSKNQFGGTLIPHYRVWKTSGLSEVMLGMWNLSKSIGISTYIRRYFHI